jgi:hypothetical protein
MECKSFCSVTVLSIFVLVGGLFLARAPIVLAQEGGVPSSGETVESQVVTSGSCSTSRLTFAANNAVNIVANNQAFQNVAGWTVTVNISGTTSTCVKFQCNAFSFTAPDQLLNVRATLGAQVGLPGEVQFDGDSDEDGDGRWARSHHADFYFRSVAPGTYTARCQFRSVFGGTVALHKPRIGVHHR